MMQAAGMASGARGRGDERAALPSGLLAQLHEAFTTKHAGTGFEVHGTDGSLIARNVMTQQPVGEVVLRTAAARRSCRSSTRSSTPGRAPVPRGGARRRPARATGEDGVWSLATAIAVRDAAGERPERSVETGG